MLGQPTHPVVYRFSSVIRQFFSIRKNAKILDSSYKIDLDLWKCLKKGKPCIISECHRTDLVIL